MGRRYGCKEVNEYSDMRLCGRAMRILILSLNKHGWKEVEARLQAECGRN
jgi:hypothetical protein